MNVYGTNFPGVPGLVHGFNDRLMWSSTTNQLDVTDFFQERVVVKGGVPVATLYKGEAEPLVTIPETFRANRVDGAPDNAVRGGCGYASQRRFGAGRDARRAAPEQRAAAHRARRTLR